MTHLILSFVICFCLLWKIAFSDKCTGSCISLKDCPELWSAIKQGQKPKTCGFEGLVPNVCCTHVDNRVTLATSPTLKREKFCVDVNGVKHSDSTIVPKEFPHMALLGYGHSNGIVWGCGGSLISLNFILTAAHCIITSSFGVVNFVRLGDLNLNSTAEPQNFLVRRKFAHPNYQPPSKYNDVGLVELDRPVRVNAFVRPACLQGRFAIDNPTWIATGWADLYFGGERADHIQKDVLKEYSNEECRQAYPPHSSMLQKGIVEDTQVCAGAEAKDTCQGNSGGPLQILNKGSIGGYTIIGVRTFGKACGISKAPGVYARVSGYINWIEGIVWGNDNNIKK